MASPSLMPAASMSSTVRSSLLHPFCGKGTYRSTLCAHVDSKSVCTPYPSTVWMQLHFSSWLIRHIQVYFMQRQAWLSGQVKIRWQCLVVVTFILCMQACHSRQASDKPPALGVKFNLLKAFMGCIVDIIFFIGGIFLMSFSFFTIICGIFSRWEIENQTYDVDCKIGWRFPYGNCKIG